MNARQRLLVACAAALPAVAALAQSSHLRPGLWEETVTVKSDNAQMNAAMEQMKQRMAQMPPEQRAAMEKMMASHGMGAGGTPNAHRVCITKEQIDRGFKPEEHGHCSRSNVSSSGNVTKFDFACQSERGSSVTGHGIYTETGDSAFAASTVADTVSPKMTMHIQSEIVGKFIASDCGDVKPVTMAK
jgi:hypothetical protein